MANDKWELLRRVVKYDNNILEEYDNVTYNIRFYMLPYSYHQEILRYKGEGDTQAIKKISDNAKIIIAETGVTPNYDITSMTMDTVHTSVYKNSSATTYKINLMIKELNGCSLTNKIAVISKLLGYQNHVCQPYHIDIWFSGYENSTGKPVKQIGEMLTYEVVISEVKTNISDTITEYNFVMVPVSNMGFNKTIKSLWSIGQIQIDKTMTIGAYKEALEKSMNDVFFNNNPHLRKCYETHKYIHIDNLIEESGHQGLMSFTKDDTFNIKIKDLSNVPVYGTPPSNTEKTEGEYDVFGNKVSDTFDGFFQRLCFKTEELKDYVARPVYRIVYVPNQISQGQELVEVHVDIVFRKNTYLEYFKANNEISKDMNQINDMQSDELERLIFSNALKKKYQYLFNGKNTSVLELNSSIDKLWFACLPSLYFLQNDSLLNDNILHYANNTYEGPSTKIKNDISTPLSIADVIRQLPKNWWDSEQSLYQARNITANKKLYLDDVYYCVDEKIKQEALTQRSILEKYELLESPSNSESTGNKNNEITSLTGYNNIYQAGNLVELKIKILGDPYWLKQFSDNVLSDSLEASTLHNFVFSLKTPIGQNQDGTYNLEDACEFSTIYQLIESTSVFEDGKFTQQLTGVINPAFIYSGTVKV